MAGLSIKIDKHKTIANLKGVLDKFKSVNKIPSVSYKEEHLIEDNLVFYSCSPAFDIEKRILSVNNYVIGFSGNFYNSKELGEGRDEKISHKIELIFFLYKHYGDSFAEHLNGEFVIVIYNKNSKELLITNDRFARIPFFYFEDKKEILLGNEKKNILCNIDSPQMDYVGLLQVFAHFHNIQGRTFLNNIHSCSPGMILTFSNGEKMVSHYYKWYYNNQSLTKKRSEVIEEIYFGIKNAIDRRIRDKDKLLLLLSGGYDSRSLALGVSESKRKDIQVYSFGEKDSYELEIANNISSTLGYKFKKRNISISPSVQSSIGAWRSEFAVNSAGHPFTALHKEMKQDGNYILSGLPGLDTLNGTYMPIKVIMRSFFSLDYPFAIFNMYSKSYANLNTIFNKEFLDNYYPSVQEEFVQSVKNIDSANKLDKYDIWFTYERQAQYSHMADLVDIDLFTFIPPYTDIDLLKVFSSIPTKDRIYQQFSKDMLYKYYSSVRNIPYDSGRGCIKNKNSFLSFQRENFEIKAGIRKSPKSVLWNYSKALLKDEKVKIRILETINNSDELKYIFDINKIKLILEEHYSGSNNNSGIIGLLLTFINAYIYFIENNVSEVPEVIREYYDS